MMLTGLFDPVLFLFKNGNGVGPKDKWAWGLDHWLRPWVVVWFCWINKKKGPFDL